MDRLMIAPRWGGRPDDDFYPWLTAQLALRVPEVSVEALSTPEGPWPSPEAWARRLDAVLGAMPPDALANTVLLGHSVGSHALLHALTRLPPGWEAGALVIVGGWWDIDLAEAAFRRRLGAEVRRVQDRLHFNAKQEPAVLDAVAGLFEVTPAL